MNKDRDGSYNARMKIQNNMADADRKSFGIDQKYGQKLVKKAKYKNEKDFGDLTDFNKRLADPKYSESAVDIFGSSGKKKRSSLKPNNKYIDKLAMNSDASLPNLFWQDMRDKSLDRSSEQNYFHIQPKASTSKHSLWSRHTYDKSNYQTNTIGNNDDPSTYDIEEKLHSLSSSQPFFGGRTPTKNSIVNQHRQHRSNVYLQTNSKTRATPLKKVGFHQSTEASFESDKSNKERSTTPLKVTKAIKVGAAKTEPVGTELVFTDIMQKQKELNGGSKESLFKEIEKVRTN